jgi:hypothetical protein
MNRNPLVSWLFIECLRAYRRPYRAVEIARLIFDDERLRFARTVTAEA